jgi:hypothetical protein
MDGRPVAGAELRRLIDRSARLWAGEAEVARSYFSSPARSRGSDLRRIARQAYKELWDGVAVQVARLERALAGEAGAGADALADAAELLRSELSHYRLFAELHEALRASGGAPLSLASLRAWAWPENDALGRLRAKHVTRHGELGRRAMRFTEGGYATLFAEGRKLRGRGGFDELVAAACERLYDDEFEHMLGGIAGLDLAELGAPEWATLEALVAEQLRARIRMRDAQFEQPVSRERLEALCEGACEPLPFDYARAEGLARAGSFPAA